MILIAALVLGGYMYNKKQAELDTLKIESEKLEAGLNAKITMMGNEIKILKRKKDGSTSSQTIYSPPEGGPTIIVPSTGTHINHNTSIIHIPQPNGPDILIMIKDRGFCFRPGMGIGFGNNGFQGHLDAKFAYFKRYSGIVTGSKTSLGVAITRHLDDMLWFRPLNVEAFVAYNPIISSKGSRYTIGIRSNF
jgi:hypothetical protein